MNIRTTEDCLDAWNRASHDAETGTGIPEEDKERVAHETDVEFACVLDTVTAYFNARFFRVS